MEDMLTLTKAPKMKSWWNAEQREVLSLHALIVKELARESEEKFAHDAAESLRRLRLT
jgi:hypothetical protein